MISNALRKLTPFALAAVAFSTSFESFADGPHEPATVPSPVRFDAFRRAPTVGIPPLYTDGPIAIAVDVVNTSKSDANGVKVTFEYGHEGTLDQVVNVPAGGKTTLHFTDPVGLTSACVPRSYGLTLQTADGKTDIRHGDVTPSCKITSSIVDPWNLAVPDRVVDAQKDTVYFNNAVLETATCTDGIKIKGWMINHSKISSPSLIVQGSVGTSVVTQTAAAFPLAAGDGKTVVLTPPAAARKDVPDKVDIKIVDWTHGLGNHVMNQGITVKTTKSCSLAFGWGDMRVLK